eukprot:scaffold2237_cov175-Ochromonas_danica.AAC.21
MQRLKVSFVDELPFLGRDLEKNQQRALKLIPVRAEAQSDYIAIEFEVLSGLSEKKDCRKVIAPVVPNSLVVVKVEEEVFSAFLLEEIGERVNVEAPRTKEKCFSLLQQFHQLAELAHGDARVENIIKVGRSLKWIDFRITEGTTTTEFGLDFVMLASSLYLTGGKKFSAATIAEIKQIVEANMDVVKKVV